MNKLCPKCGTVVPDNSNYCSHCGCEMSSQRSYQQPPQYTPQQPQYGNPYYDNNPFNSSGPEGKCRGIAALLAIFIGALGIHYFYLNKAGGGIITILLCIISCGIWSIVTFIQGIYFLCISNAEFEHKFVQSTSSFPVF
ncbi:MAG: TM2 domain-containing protein [Muribaculaceae bacterium]|nr:TM2 domain-containing protein [Muribaculaceae bacterium]